MRRAACRRPTAQEKRHEFDERFPPGAARQPVRRGPAGRDRLSSPSPGRVDHRRIGSRHGESSGGQWQPVRRRVRGRDGQRSAPNATEPVYAVLGMATLLAGTTYAPVMAALMVSEMTGQYGLLTVFLPACVVATLVSQHLHPKSVYGLGAGCAEPES